MPTLTLPDGPLALSMSGGGSKGAYTVGVVQYLHEEEGVDDYRIILGTSTGALIAAMVGAFLATGDPSHIDQLIHLYSTVKTGDILEPRYSLVHETLGEMGSLGAALLTGGESVYKTGPLEKLTADVLPDKVWRRMIRVGQRARGPIEIGFATVNLQTGANQLISNRTHPDVAMLKSAMLASAMFPIFMPPVVGPDNEQRVDGGIKDYNPLEHVFTSDLIDDVNGIVAISLDRTEYPRTDRHYTEVAHLLEQNLNLMVHGIFETDIRSAQLWNVILKVKEQLTAGAWRDIVTSLPQDVQDYVRGHARAKRYVPIVHIEPQRKIDLDTLSFEQPKMRQFVRHGFRDARALFR